MAGTVDDSIEKLRYRDEESDKRLQELLREQSNFARHYELLRAQISSIFLAGSAAVLGLALKDGPSYGSGFILVFIGVCGLLLSYFYHQAHIYHWRLMHTLRKAYVKGSATISLPVGVTRGSVLEIKAIFKEYWKRADNPKLLQDIYIRAYPIESIWLVIHVAVVSAGLVVIYFRHALVAVGGGSVGG
jgi:hypothetical protein